MKERNNPNAVIQQITMDVVFKSYKMTLPLEYLYKLKIQRVPLYLLVIFLLTTLSDIHEIDICR